jgi:hypothetical protein
MEKVAYQDKWLGQQINRAAFLILEEKSLPRDSNTMFSSKNT